MELDILLDLLLYTQMISKKLFSCQYTMCRTRLYINAPGCKTETSIKWSIESWYFPVKSHIKPHVVICKRSMSASDSRCGRSCSTCVAMCIVRISVLRRDALDAVWSPLILFILILISLAHSPQILVYFQKNPLIIFQFIKS